MQILSLLLRVRVPTGAESLDINRELYSTPSGSRQLTDVKFDFFKSHWFVTITLTVTEPFVTTWRRLMQRQIKRGRVWFVLMPPPPSPLSHISLFDSNILATTRYHVILPNVKYVKSTCLKIILSVFRPKCKEKYLCFLDQSLDPPFPSPSPSK